MLRYPAYVGLLSTGEPDHVGRAMRVDNGTSIVSLSPI